MRNVTSVLVGLVAICTSSLEAQVFCGHAVWTGCPNGGHYLTSLHDDWQNPHLECMICVAGWGLCHPLCSYSFDAQTSGSQKTAYEQIIAAARKGDALAVLRLAPAAPQFVQFHERRNAIQVWSCSRDVLIASLTLPMVVGVPDWGGRSHGAIVISGPLK